jgi:hypothetical protein
MAGGFSDVCVLILFLLWDRFNRRISGCFRRISRKVRKTPRELLSTLSTMNLSYRSASLKEQSSSLPKHQYSQQRHGSTSRIPMEVTKIKEPFGYHFTNIDIPDHGNLKMVQLRILPSTTTSNNSYIRFLGLRSLPFHPFPFPLGLLSRFRHCFVNSLFCGRIPSLVNATRFPLCLGGLSSNVML